MVMMKEGVTGDTARKAIKALSTVTEAILGNSPSDNSWIDKLDDKTAITTFEVLEKSIQATANLGAVKK